MNLARLSAAVREAPRAEKTYVAFVLVAALGAPIVLIGVVSGQHTVLIVGIVLAGLCVLDLMFVFPLLSARRGRRRKPE